MSKFKELLKEIGQRSAAVLVVLMAPAMMLLAQEMNKKFSMTTQMFLNEVKEQAEQPRSAPRRAPRRQTSENTQMLKQRRLIASPDTIGGVAYISCFIHLKDVNDLSDVRSLGVEVEETFEGLDFITANVPVEQLEQLADIDNVTKIKVAQQMRMLTDVARQKTNTDDVLTQSTDAITAGLNTKYDGSGVVLGIIDTGIDFQHIAFKDKNGNSRIKRAYVSDGSSTVQEYTTITASEPTTDDNMEDHGTHTATTAGGSSVITTSTSVTVTDDHAGATFGGMAPGADLYLAGINGLEDTHIYAAIKKMVTYADSQNKPLVVSNSWGSGMGPRDGTGELADLVAQYFGDGHPNHVILFASSNDAGHRTGNEGGGFFVKKSSATSGSPLGTIIRTDSYGGEYYTGLLAVAWATKKLYCRLHVLNNSTGSVLKSWTVTSTKSNFTGMYSYYSSNPSITLDQDNGKYSLTVYASNTMQAYGDYTLAIEVYPTSSADVNMWAGDWTYFTNHLTTSGRTWIAGTDDMCVSDEATIPNAIAVGAYVSKNKVKNYQNSTTTYYSGSVGDIAYFSSYATAKQSPTGEAYPWITAPGSQVVAGVNAYHTASDSYSYFHSSNKAALVVNNSTNPYGSMEGTSMATPVAAGIVALWLQAAKSVNMDLTVNDVKNIMRQTAINDNYTTTGANASHFGNGKIDALAGIRYILAAGEQPVLMASTTNISFANKYTPGLSKTATFNVIGSYLRGDVTVTVNDESGTFSVDTPTIPMASAEKGATITVTWTPTGVGETSATLTLSSNEAEDVVITLSAIAVEDTAPETLLYESLSGYEGSDGSTAMTPTSQYLDYSGWETLTKVFPGNSSNAYANGGSLKLGTSTAKGLMKTGSIPLVGSGTLTFYLKKNNMDTGKLKVTVTGAETDVQSFEPQSKWTLCTVNLSNATGDVVITLETSSKRAYLDEITLVSGGTIPDVVFNNNGAGNAESIAAYAGKKVNATLAGRTLYKDGTWNTLCLPFSVTIADSPLADADVRALSSASHDGESLTLNFTEEGDVKTLAAGTPYIIRWAAGSDIVEPVFEQVVIDDSKNDFVSSDGKVRFMGTYDLITFNAENQSVRFMGGANTLNHPLSGARIGAFRSYFLLSDDASAKQIVLNFDGTSDPDAIVSPLGETEEGAVIYNLSGQQIVNGRWSTGKLPRGIYIHNGRKVVK